MAGSHSRFVSHMRVTRAKNLPMHPDDARVARAVEGDLDELEHLLRALEPELRSSLSIDSRWNRSFDRDDVLQVSYLEAYLRIRTLRTPTVAGLKGWLWRIAENNLKDAIRGLERGKRPDAKHRLTRGPEGESARTLLAAMTGNDPTAGGQVSGKEDVERMRDAIDRLPASYRRIIDEVDLAERTIAEVAADWDKSVGALHMLRSRAHDRLRELLR